MWVFILFIAGFAAGCAVSCIIAGVKFAGTLMVRMDGEGGGPILFLELSRGIRSVGKDRYVVMKVDAQGKQGLL